MCLYPLLENLFFCLFFLGVVGFPSKNGLNPLKVKPFFWEGFFFAILGCRGGPGDAFCEIKDGSGPSQTKITML